MVHTTCRQAPAKNDHIAATNLWRVKHKRLIRKDSWGVGLGLAARGIHKITIAGRSFAVRFKLRILGKFPLQILLGKHPQLACLSSPKPYPL